MVGGNLCRCTGYANIKKAVHPRRRARCADRRMTTEAVRRAGPPARGRPADRRQGPLPRRHRRTPRWPPPSCASPHAHARITDIDVEGALDVEGLVAIYTYDDLSGPMAEPLPVLIPHPQLTAAAHRLPAGPRRRAARRRAGGHGGGHRPVRRRGRRRADRRQLRGTARRRRRRRRARGEGRRARRRPGQRGRPAPPGDRRRRAGAGRRRRTRCSFTQYIERSASMPMEGKGVHARWDADDRSLRVYSSTQASTSVRAAIAAKLELSLDKVEVIAPDVGGGFGVKIVHPWPEELLVPMAAIALQAEVKWAEDRREHFISSAHERQQRQDITVGLRRRRPDHRARRPRAARPRRVHALRDHRPDHHRDPAGRPVRDPRVPGARRQRLHEHRDRDAVPRRRAAAGLLRDGAHDGPHRRRARAGPRRRARAEPDPARPVPLRPPPDVPGRPAGHLRLGRLPGAGGQAEGRWSAGRRPRRSGPRPPPAGSTSASAWRCTWRAPGRGRTRAGTCRCSAAARCWCRPG